MSEVKEFYDNYKADLWKAKELPEQREIDFRGWYCIFFNGEPIIATQDKLKAEFLVNDFCDTLAEKLQYEIRQITKKVPFNEQSL